MEQTIETQDSTTEATTPVLKKYTADLVLYRPYTMQVEVEAESFDEAVDLVNAMIEEGTLHFDQFTTSHELSECEVDFAEINPPFDPENDFTEVDEPEA
jgi:hypothetical protein